MAEEFYFLAEKRETLVYTVKEVTSNLKILLETNFNFIAVEGEISNLKQSQVGHIYFNLIDEEASLRCVIFKRYISEKIKICLKNGLKVCTFGTISFYQKGGECFFLVKDVWPTGEGLIALQKEYLLKKYAHLFTKERKKELPSFPKKIALITSLYGAAIKDFLKIAFSRWKVHILIYPVKVQGKGAEKEIVNAIRDINMFFQDVDIIVITRGGGSVEDLAPFYTEEIILGISESKIPVVSAVGHEIDITLCDLIADKRCPTPTAAAQEILPDPSYLKNKLLSYSTHLTKLIKIKLSEKHSKILHYKIRIEQNSPTDKLQSLEKQLTSYSMKLFLNIKRKLENKEKKLLSLKERILKQSVEEKLNNTLQHLNFLKNKLDFLIHTHLEKKEKRVNHLRNLLFSLSPLNILKRGYSIIKKVGTGKIVKDSKEVTQEEHLEVILAKGALIVKVMEVKDGKE